MGSVFSCLNVDDLEDLVNRNSSALRNCPCANCFVQNFAYAYSSLFRNEEVDSLPSSIQGAASRTSVASLDSSLSDMYRAPPRPLPYDADPGYIRLQQKGTSHSHDETEPLRSSTDVDSECVSGGDKWNGSKEHLSRSSMKLLSTKETTGFVVVDTSSEEECPTCLEEYTPENPKIVTKCSHHYHLGCIYEWMERSESCPVCGKVMAFDETTQS